MRYVKIKPNANCKRSPDGRLIYVECGLPDAKGNAPKFILHDGEDLSIPAWAAAELVERGHQVTEVNEIRNGAHVALPGVGVEHIDIAQELATAPDGEIDRFLRHHDFHEHLMHHEPAGRERLDQHIKSETAKNGGVRPAISHTPFHTPDQLRAKAFELHAKHYKSGQLTRTG